MKEMGNIMDSGLVYTQIQKLLLNNEEVILPNVGVFRVESSPASFLQDGKTILPPSKKLVFENVMIHGARLPWQEDLGEQIVGALAKQDEFEVPGFGVFAKTGQGGISFTVNDSFDFAPDNFSLEAIQLEVNEMPAEEVKVQPEEKPAPQSGQKRSPKWIVYVAAVVAVVVLLVLLVVIFKEQLKPLIENILYTKEELEIMQKWAAQ